MRTSLVTRTHLPGPRRNAQEGWSAASDLQYGADDSADGQPDLHGEGEKRPGGAAIGVAHVTDGIQDARDQVDDPEQNAGLQAGVEAVGEKQWHEEDELLDAVLVCSVQP